MNSEQHQSSHKFIKISLILLLFIYAINYTFRIFSTNGLVQLLLIGIYAYIFMRFIYKVLPSYIYKLENNQLIIIRKFSDKYFFTYRIELSKIKDLQQEKKFSIKFWNDFYNQHSRVYKLIEEQVIYFSPSQNFMNELKKKL